jgi:hypothetical protein
LKPHAPGGLSGAKSTGAGAAGGSGGEIGSKVRSGGVTKVKQRKEGTRRSTRVVGISNSAAAAAAAVAAATSRKRGGGATAHGTAAAGPSYPSPAADAAAPVVVPGDLSGAREGDTECEGGAGAGAGAMQLHAIAGTTGAAMQGQVFAAGPSEPRQPPAHLPTGNSSNSSSKGGSGRVGGAQVQPRPASNQPPDFMAKLAAHLSDHYGFTGSLEGWTCKPFLSTTGKGDGKLRWFPKFVHPSFPVCTCYAHVARVLGIE